MKTYQLIVGDRVHQIRLSDEELERLTGSKPAATDNWPSEKQLKFARNIAASLKISMPTGCEQDKGACWNFINTHKDKLKDNPPWLKK